MFDLKTSPLIILSKEKRKLLEILLELIQCSNDIVPILLRPIFLPIPLINIKIWMQSFQRSWNEETSANKLMTSYVNKVII